MHLSYSISKYKDKTYKSYAIAESYCIGEKVKKRTIGLIGKLTEVQAKQVQLICKVMEDDSQILANLNDLFNTTTIIIHSFNSNNFLFL